MTIKLTRQCTSDSNPNPACHADFTINGRPGHQKLAHDGLSRSALPEPERGLSLGRNQHSTKLSECTDFCFTLRGETIAAPAWCLCGTVERTTMRL
jgi:hypothetical protein